MNSDAFETAAGSVYKTNDLERQIRSALSLGQGMYPTNECPYAPGEDTGIESQVYMVGPGSSLPAFKHPVILPNKGGDTMGGEVVVDGRGFTRLGRDGEIVQSSKAEYMFNIGRAYLTKLAVSEPSTVLLNFSDTPTEIFARWLTDRLNSQLHVDLEDQLVIRACAAWFYTNQFFDEKDFMKDEKDRCIARAARANGIDMRQWERIMGKDELPWCGTVDLFCSLVKQKTEEAIRVDGLDRRFVAQVTVGSWRGAQGREIVAVGLEHPPTWLAMLQLCAYESSFYKKMPLGETVERSMKRRDEKDAFLLSFARLPY